MTQSRVKSLLWCTALAVGVATQVAAADKLALVVAGDVDARDAALQMSETLLGLGFVVQRLEEPSGTDLTDALAQLDAATDVTAIFYAGGDAPEQDFLRATDAPRFVFLDTCLADEIADAPENVFVATQGAACNVSLTDVLLERLTVPGLRSDQWELTEDFRAVSALEAPYVFRAPTSDVRLTTDDYTMLDTLSPAARARMIALWRDAGIVVDVAGAVAVAPLVMAPQSVVVSPIRPVAPSAVVTPIAPRVVGGVVPRAQDVTVVARPLTAPIDLPTAGQGGLPAPSILVGFVVDEPLALPDAPQVPDEPLAGNGFGFEDFAAREDLRNQDADLFGGLLEAGAFDPPEDEIARALQIELQRINCYTSGIDGAWGPGSQRALAEYYAQLGADAAGSDPNVGAFRQVIARNDVRCPEPVVIAAPAPAPARAAQPAAAQSRRAAPATAQAAAPAPAAPAPAAPTGRRVINQSGGTGVFR